MKDLILDSKNSHWKNDARIFMQQQIPFTVENWDVAFDGEVSTALLKEFDYIFRIYPKSERARFRPRISP